MIKGLAYFLSLVIINAFHKFCLRFIYSLIFFISVSYFNKVSSCFYNNSFLSLIILYYPKANHFLFLSATIVSSNHLYLKLPFIFLSLTKILFLKVHYSPSLALRIHSNLSPSSLVSLFFWKLLFSCYSWQLSLLILIFIFYLNWSFSVLWIW